MNNKSMMTEDTAQGRKGRKSVTALEEEQGGWVQKISLVVLLNICDLESVHMTTPPSLLVPILLPLGSFASFCKRMCRKFQVNISREAHLCI